MLGHRNQVLHLNKALYLIRGNPIKLGSLLSSLAPGSVDFTAILNPPAGSHSWFSQVHHIPGDRSAHLTFLVPDQIQENDDLLTFIDFLCFQAGEMGALNLLADIEEYNPLFELLRRTGFCVFSWESIWQLPGLTGSAPSEASWIKPSAQDEINIRSLYQTLIPPLVQNAEPFTNGNTPRLVYKVNNEIQAYVESYSGPAGIYLVPVIHPSVENIDALLRDLVSHFQGDGRAVYLQVRSYQAWLTDMLHEFGAQPSPRFALLVKHLAVTQLSPIKETQRVRAEGRQAEPTAPIVNQYLRKDSPSEEVK